MSAHEDNPAVVTCTPDLILVAVARKRSQLGLALSQIAPQLSANVFVDLVQSALWPKKNQRANVKANRKTCIKVNSLAM